MLFSKHTLAIVGYYAANAQAFWILSPPDPAVIAERAVSSTSSDSSTSTSSVSCTSLTKISTLATFSVTTLTYPINRATASSTIYDNSPQFQPSTVYPTTVYTTAATSISTVLVTPSTTIATSRTTVRVPAPYEFEDIQDSLSGWVDDGLGLPDPANKKRAAAKCTVTVSSIKTVYTSTSTAKAFTTLSGTDNIFPRTSSTTTLDDVGLSLFYKTYTGPATTTVTTPRTVTTSYRTTVTTTVTLPTQTFAGTTVSIYEACRTHNQAVRQASPAPPQGTSYKIANSAQVQLNGTFASAYDCCAAAIEYGGVGYWQWSAKYGCQIQQTPDGLKGGGNNCLQGKWGFSVNYYDADNATYNLVPRLTGNGYCGRVGFALPYPESQKGTGGP